MFVRKYNTNQTSTVVTKEGQVLSGKYRCYAGKGQVLSGKYKCYKERKMISGMYKYKCYKVCTVVTGKVQVLSDK